MTSLGSTMSFRLLLYRRQHRRQAVPITHGHEDHIGGFPFPLKQIMSLFALGLPHLPWSRGKLKSMASFVMPNEINQNTELHSKNLSNLLPYDSLRFQKPLGWFTPLKEKLSVPETSLDFTLLGGNRLDLHRMAVSRRRRSLSALRLNQRGNSLPTLKSIQ